MFCQLTYFCISSLCSHRCNMINNANYLQIILLPTKTDYTGQSQLSISPKLTEFIDEN